MSTRDLSDAVVAVVGASGGLGAPLTHLLAERGARLVLAGPHPERLEALRVPGAACVAADLRNPDAGDTVVATATDRFGGLDGLINVAGVVAFGPLADTDDVVIEELFLTNVVGPLWLLRRAIDALSASKGFVCNVSAVVAEQPMADMAAYSASKAALRAADAALGRELRRRGITVCDARPPHTETGLADRPLSGVAPRLPQGLEPAAVAARLVAAIEAGETDVPSSAFAAT